MANFAHYFNSNFASCRHLANAHDQHRVRDVRIYQIPGEVDFVGVTDGVDKWIAPVADELFSVNIKKLLRDLQDDPGIRLPITGSERRQRPRRALIVDNEVLIPAEPQQSLQRRPGRSEAPSRIRRQLV